jgi:cell division protease FtsH
MVCSWGMSDKMGPLSYGENGEHPFLGRELVQHKDYSEETAKAIDDEVRAIVEESYDNAKNLLRENIDILHNIAKALLEYETISGKDIDDLIAGRELKPRDKTPDDPGQDTITPPDEVHHSASGGGVHRNAAADAPPQAGYTPVSERPEPSGEPAEHQPESKDNSENEEFTLEEDDKDKNA